MSTKKKALSFLILLVFSYFLGGNSKKIETIENSRNIETEKIIYATSNSEEEVYLSDINYIPNQSYAGWGSIIYNKTDSNSKISVKIENSAFSFDKGIWAHATSQVTYDISAYNYKYFTAFAGINTSSNAGNGVKFYVYTSQTGKDWVQQKPLFEELKLPGVNATKVKVELNGAKYLRLIANDNGANGNDHSVWADAKLTNTLEEKFAFKSVEEYNEIIKSLDKNHTNINGELELNLLRRELVKKVGQYTLNSFSNESEANKKTIDWLFNNQDVLRYFIMGGNPERSYYNALTQLSLLYNTYKEDFSNNEVTKYGTKLSDLYTRMAIAMALTHDFSFGLWIDQSKENLSVAVNRYKIYKDMHKNGNFVILRNNDGTPILNADGTPKLDVTKWFENYSVEEMRYIFNNQSDDEEVLWLNEYTQSFIDADQKNYSKWISPHPYMDYRTENLGQAAFYDPNKKDDWDKTFKGVFSKYNVTYRNGLKKIWMFLRNDQGILTGAVCGGISKIGSTTRVVHGIPAVVIGQPGHAAILYYWQDADGNGFWNIDNDVSGWAYSERGERLLLGWGNANTNYAKGSHQVVYMALSQAALNDYDNLVKSEELIMLTDVYASDKKLQEEMYKNAIDIQSINLDAWLNLINLYLKDSTKTEEEYFNLAEQLSESLKYYPLPMYQLTNLIKPKLTSVEYSYKFTLLQTRILKEASQMPNDTTKVMQPSLTRLIANFLLGQMDTSIATFSFDGEDAGKIVLSSRFDGNGIRWDYAINGKGENDTWDESDFKEVSFTAQEEHKLKLTDEEINSITAENDIYIHIVGVSYSEDNIYKIDINESTGLPATLFASDLENKLLGAVDTIEWKYNETDSWTRYGSKQPVLTGDKTLIVRMGATGTRLAQKESAIYNFTDDGDNKKRKYIPIEHLSLHAVSTEATSNGGSATYALDANYNTRWHSAWDGSDTKRFITVKLDRPYNISAVEFVPAGGGNGKIFDGTIYGSMDGENWFVLTQRKNITYVNQADTLAQVKDNIKSFDIEDALRVQYVKIVADRTNGNWFTARAFNFYEDTTVKNVATFSFDGSKPGIIELVDEFKNTNWKYSLDGGNTFKDGSKGSQQLTKEEIESINAENDIKIKLAGDDTEYKINIKKGETPTLGYLNDLENRPIAQPNKEKLEWKIEDGKWTSYKDEEPNVVGNKTLYVRTKATGNVTASDVIEYEFTEDNQPANRKYISIKHLTIHSYNSQSKDTTRPFYAPNIIDGNINTMWHTDFAENLKTAGKTAYITIKLDEVKSLSALEFIHKKYRDADPSFTKNAIVYTSMDGEDWVEAGRLENIPQEENIFRMIDFDKSTECQYVKLELDTYDMFASLLMVNLYEDRTNLKVPTAEVEYSTTTPTNQDVTVKLVNPSTEIKITNNDGKDTYTFTENGEFTFKFVDKNGTEGEATAKVDWIIKTLPNVTIEYSTTDLTNKDVTASISFDRDKTIIVDSEGNTIKTLSLGEKYAVTFTENGKKKINFVGPYGNASTTTISVDWIDKEAPVGTLTYSTTEPTNKDVVVTLTANEDITITNNGGSAIYTFKDNGTFTFEFKDKAGNKSTATASVSWIDRDLAMPTITYSTTKPTRENVVATITFDKDGVVVEDGNTHTFTENGTYEFKYTGHAGNEGVAIAKVDWIDRKVPEATISYSQTGITNQDVEATITFDEENVKITNNNGSNKHTFTSNGEFTFEFVDEAGNKGSVEAVVIIIDKVVPTAEVEYSTKDLTNKDVVVKLVNVSEEIIVTNNNGKLDYTFTENGEFTFEFKDKAGNTNSVTAKVDNIDKVVPTAEVEYSTKEITNQDVVLTLKPSKEVTIVNQNLEFTKNEDGTYTVVIKENGEYIIKMLDSVGNCGQVEVNVTWIDKTSPVGTLKYNITEATNKDVVVTLTANEEIKVTNNDGKDTYTFTENGEFTFEFEDLAGNKGTAKAVVNWINKNIPEGKISYSTTDKTENPVVATLTVDKDITITNNGGKNTYTFTKNGEFTFEFVDKLGNIGSATAKVDWIIVKELEVSVEYDVTTPTAGKVVATLKTNKPVTVTNNDGNKTYIFTENGEFTFEYVDEEGKKGSITAKVDWIDSSAPTAEVEYSIKEFTNKDVVVKLVNPNRKITITNNDGKDTYTFTKNGEFIFEYVDENGRKGATKAKVNWIDKEVAEVTVVYNITSYTNKDVVATLLSEEEIKITNNGGKNTYKFTKNGEFTFEYVDKYGNKGIAKATVEWIDKTAIISTIHYSITKKTNKNVVATLQTNKVVRVINNNGKKTYTFTKNGTFTFEYEDKYGNKGKTTAKVNWIEKANNTKPSSNTNKNSNKPISSNTNSNSNSNSGVNSNSNIDDSNSNINSNIEESNSNSNIESNSNSNSESNSNSNEVTEEKKSSKGLTIATIGLLLIIIGFVAFRFTKRK